MVWCKKGCPLFGFLLFINVVSAVAAFFIGKDDIGRLTRVELVDLVSSFEHGDIPFEEIDEDALASLEHCPKQPIVWTGLVLHCCRL